MTQVLIAVAEGEENLAEQLGERLERDGHAVAHSGRVFVGDSIIAEASKALTAGASVVVCASVRAMGTAWPHQLVNAARKRRCPLFVLQMQRDVYVEPILFGERALAYWEDPATAVDQLLAALRMQEIGSADAGPHELEAARTRYRQLALAAVDIIDLANLPETDRFVVTRQLELRRLYVPLRLITEAAPGAEISEERFADLEARRSVKAVAAEVDARPPLGERLEASRRLVILGDPGAGKTTLIRWLATAYLLRLRADPDLRELPDVATLPDSDLLPIIVRCRDLDAAAIDGSLEDILRRTLRKSEVPSETMEILITALREDLTSGRGLLLIDGLDEIQDPGDRLRFCTQLEQIHLAYPDAWVVVTSRIVGYREMGTRIGRGFEHLTVAELSPTEKDDFARRWCEATEPPGRRETAADELIADIHSADRIERLTGNPMLLTTMALVKRKVGKLPSGRAELYGDAVDVLLRWRREVDEPIDHREALPQLQYIAYAMCELGEQQLREEVILDLLERMRDEYPRIRPVANHTPEEFLQLLERRTAILVQAGRVKHGGTMQPVYEFRHLTFQEYLAGRALVEGRYPGRDVNLTLAETVAPLAGRTTPFEHGDDEEVGISENWREALRLCVSECSDDVVDEVVLALLEPRPGEDPAVARPRAMLAAQCLTDEPNVSDEAAEQVLRGLVRRIDGRDGGEYGFSAVDAVIEELMAAQPGRLLLTCLTDEFLDRALPGRLDVAAVRMKAALRDSPESHGALRAWLERLGAQLEDEGRAFVDAALELGVAQMRSGLSYRFKAILEATPELIETVISRLAAAATGDGPAATAAVLGYIGAASIKPSGDDRLRPILEDDSTPVSHIAVVVEATPYSALTPAVARRLIEHPDRDATRATIQQFGLAADPEVRELLRHYVDDPDVQPIVLASSQPHEVTLDDLRRLLEGNAGTARTAAVRLVLGMDSEEGDELIRQLLASDPGRAALALRQMSHAPRPRFLDAVIAAVDSEHPEVRTAALGTLASWNAELPLGRLRAWVHSDLPDVRASAATLLASAAAPAQEEFARLLHDANDAVRDAALRALAGVDDAWTIDVLVDCLVSETPPLQGVALGALIAKGQVGVDAALTVLRRNDQPPLQLWLPAIVAPRAEMRILDLIDYLEPAARRDVLSAAVMFGTDEVAQLLLSEDLDGLNPFLDPRTPITRERIGDVAQALAKDPAEILAMYQELQRHYPIAIDAAAIDA